MSGWQRLWVIACVVLALMVGTLAESYWPTPEVDKMLHDLNVKSNEQLLSVMKLATEYPNAAPGLIDSTHNVDQVNFNISQEEERYRGAVKSLWSRQVACILLFSAIWLGACGLLYVLGMIGGWVIVGFRPSQRKHE